MSKIFFASDNCAMVHEKVLKEMQNINIGHDYSYGDDQYTINAKRQIEACFNRPCSVFFVYNGTGANVLALKSCLKTYQALITTDTSHVFEDETGAFENFVGSKNLTIKTDIGKFRVEYAKPYLEYLGSIHQVQPKAISIAQTTEFGTSYTVSEIAEICKFAHENHMYVHVDGARIANACVNFDTNLNEMISKTGVDMLSLGATKNGLMFGEAIVVFDDDLASELKYIIKHGMQLHSKQRFIACQYSAIFSDNLFYENARCANRMAKKIEKGLKDNGIKVLYPVEGNGVFVEFSEIMANRLLERYFFHGWLEKDSYRLMAAFDTKEEDVDAFIDDVARIKEELSKGE